MALDYQLQIDELRQMVETRLTAFFCGTGLEEAMRYSLLAGGKRIRPVLTMAFCQAAGGEVAEALDFGCGVEMLHTYSLIHDDLPCMDNDDLRRGKPTCHKVYGECIATLAGDALQAEAFRTVLCAEGPWSEDKTAPMTAAAILAEAAGVNGMCGGQYYDTIGDGESHCVEELECIHDKKTGALLRAACMMGVAASVGHRKVDASCMESAKLYAAHLGMAFQIRDDILDATSTTQELGKPVGSDEANQKTTYVTLLGVEACEQLVLDHTRQAKEALARGKWSGDIQLLSWLADQLALRNN